MNDDLRDRIRRLEARLAADPEFARRHAAWLRAQRWLLAHYGPREGGPPHVEAGRLLGRLN